MDREAQASFDDLGDLPQESGRELIIVTQLPVIEERLREVKAQVEIAVAEAKSMVATADTVQAVKSRRAELNKQLDALETQRKAVKAQIMAPYNQFEAVYKECISGPFKEADKSLKATVDSFEAELKVATKEKLEAYYKELCQMEKIDWLPFDRAMALGNIKIGMADTKSQTPRRLMDEIGSVVATVAIGMEQIRRMDDSAEIMAEFKVCVDVGKAVANVQGRKRLIQAEKEAAERRKEEEAAEAERVAKLAAIVESAKPVAPTATPATAPTAETGERIFPEFRFTVYNCTRTQLIKVREFLKQEGIRYGK